LETAPEFLDKKGLAYTQWLEFATSGEQILNVIKSRAKLSAIGLDGIGYQMVKLGGISAVKFHEAVIPQDHYREENSEIMENGSDSFAL
jgi:3-hydroxymyristoyl/3-hydroxydecanoyl-(acyl carrier protein) dehydratase